MRSKLNMDMAFGIAASALFLISLLIHVLTFWSFNIQERFPAIWLLHIGIFLFFIPVLLKQKIEEKRKDEELITLSLTATEPAPLVPRSIAEGLGFPNWLTIVYLALGFYVMANFVVFGLGAEGTPGQSGDKFVLKNRTTVIREITREEYDLASAHVLHGFSGHWLIFYFYFASASLIAASKKS